MKCHKPDKPYSVYRAGGFFAKRPLRGFGDEGVAVAAVGEAAVEIKGSAFNTAPSEDFSTSPGHKKATRNRLVKWITTLAIVCGLALIAYAALTFGYGYIQAKVGQGELRSLFHISGNGSVDPDYLQRESAAMQSRLNKLDPVGEINIPGIGARWMIVEGSDKDALSKGPGHVEGTSLPGADGNFTVAGDRVLYGAPFLKLDEVKIGDLVKVKMPYATFSYRVQETFIVTPDDVSVLEPVGYEAITLLTCDPPWDIKQRIVVRGKLELVQPAGTEI